MGKVNRFEDLEVWQKGMQLAEDIFFITRNEQFAREYGIKDQIIRASISISNNISEGFEYDNRKDFIKFLRYSKGSTGEVRNMVVYLKRVGLISNEVHDKLTNDAVILSKQLFAFINYLKNNNN
ncbi:MAG: four helix bundle protein [Ignavibacteria bacterium]|nr:four helix bundle protein [Ignavibacteria bacterium]